MFAGLTAPVGYLMCDGSEISRATYSTLFAAIGTSFGIGDNSTTFNIPDMIGASPAGAGTSSGYSANETVYLGTKTDDSFQNHDHQTGFVLVPSGTNGAINVDMTNTTGVIYQAQVMTGGAVSGRASTVTKGKTVGMNFIIKT